MAVIRGRGHLALGEGGDALAPGRHLPWERGHLARRVTSGRAGSPRSQEKARVRAYALTLIRCSPSAEACRYSAALVSMPAFFSSCVILSSKMRNTSNHWSKPAVHSVETPVVLGLHSVQASVGLVEHHDHWYQHAHQGGDVAQCFPIHFRASPTGIPNYPKLNGSAVNDEVRVWICAYDPQKTPR